jgi:hypothetical protein
VSLSTPNGRPGLVDTTTGCLFALAFLPQAIFISELFQRRRNQVFSNRKAMLDFCILKPQKSTMKLAAIISIFPIRKAPRVHMQNRIKVTDA